MEDKPTPTDKKTVSVEEMIELQRQRHEQALHDENLGQLDCISSASFEKNTAAENEANGNTEQNFDNNEDSSYFQNMPDDQALDDAPNFADYDDLDTGQSLPEYDDNQGNQSKNNKSQGPKKGHKRAADKNGFDSQFTKDFLWECLFARDKGNGNLYSHLYAEKFACLHKEYWLEYNGHHWDMCDISRVQNSVEGAVDQYALLADDVRDQINNLRAEADAGDDKSKADIKRLENKYKIIKTTINHLHTVNGVNHCLTFSRANDKTTLINTEMLDADLNALCCDNGIIDMRTGEIRKGVPSDYVTRTCKGEWKGLDEKAPKWEQMVYEVLGENKDVTHYFQKLVGMAMCGHITEKIFVILLGEDGDSGKTTIFETLFEVLSGYVAPMPVEMLLDRKNPKDPDSPTPSIMSLKGRRLTWASEPGENRRFSVENIKLMSGNDTLTGRNPWDKDMTSFAPTHTLFLLTNHKMRASAHDQAFWSRLRLIDCPFNFVANPDPQNKRHKQRKDGLRQQIVDEEKAGILAWVVSGYIAYLMEGIEPPAAVKESTDKYRREEDLMAYFIDECLEKVEVSVCKEDSRIGAADLYELFKNWHTTNHSKYVPSGTLFGKIAAKHIEKKKDGGKIYYIGYQITTEAKGAYA